MLSSLNGMRWQNPLSVFSDDGSLAYAVIQKEVVIMYPDTSGKPFYDTTHFAWTSIYRKQKGEWKVEPNFSANKKCRKKQNPSQKEKGFQKNDYT